MFFEIKLNSILKDKEQLLQDYFMMMMIKFVEHKFLCAKFEQQTSRGKAYEHDLSHSTWQKKPLL